MKRTFYMYDFLVKNLLRLRNDRRGVTALEYGLMAALIAVVIIAAVPLLGAGITNAFTDVGTALTNHGAAVH
jgi:pilus assembly protein Flp/PilA